MAADHRSDLVGQQDQRGDVEAHLTIDLVADFARALDHDDALGTGPMVSSCSHSTSWMTVISRVSIRP